jgi:tetratricopeptide (TPR) repeat protein
LEWLARLDADYENLRLALEWSLSKASAEPSLRLCAGLGRFWAIRCYWIEGTKWLAAALAKPAQDKDTSENTFRVRALCQDATLANSLDDLERMKNSATLALQLAEQGSDPRDAAIARFYVGFQLYRLGEENQAHPFLEQSAAAFQKLHDAYWEAYTDRWLSFVEVNQGKPLTPERMQQTIELARKNGERFILAMSLLDYAIWLSERERVQEARKYVDEAIKLSKQIGSSVILSVFAQTNLAQIEWLEGNRQQARTLLIEAQTHVRLLGERQTAALCGVSLGLLSMEEGNLAEAQTYIEEALLTFHELAVNFSIALAKERLGILYALQGNSKKSKQYLQESVTLVTNQDLFFWSSFLQTLFMLPDLQKQENSVRLLGAMHRFEEQTGTSFEPVIRRYRVRAESQARASLGEAAFESLSAEGRNMTLDQAIDLAKKLIEDM